jgi:hypothetical protein
LKPRTTTALSLIGARPLASAAAIPAKTFLMSPPRVIRRKRSGSRVSMLMLTRSSPAAARAGASFGQEERVGRQRDLLDAGQRLDRRDQRGQAGAHRRLAAGEAELAEAELGRQADDAQQLVVGQQLVLRGELHPGGGHAVDAAQVAAVGQRDPQVVDPPPEPVDTTPSSSGMISFPAAPRSVAVTGSCVSKTTLPLPTPASDRYPTRQVLPLARGSRPRRWTIPQPRERRLSILNSIKNRRVGQPGGIRLSASCQAQVRRAPV